MKTTSLPLYQPIQLASDWLERVKTLRQILASMGWESQTNRNGLYANQGVNHFTIRDGDIAKAEFIVIGRIGIALLDKEHETIAEVIC